MIQRYHNEPVGLRVMPEPGDYLKLHDRILPDGSEQITVGRGESWSVLACKEVYGKASKAVQGQVGMPGNGYHSTHSGTQSEAAVGGKVAYIEHGVAQKQCQHGQRADEAQLQGGLDQR